MNQSTQVPGRINQMLVWGMTSIVMYTLLFLYEQQILEWSSRGQWFFIFPILIAFAFSIVHGQFTGKFWQCLNIRARK